MGGWVGGFTLEECSRRLQATPMFTAVSSLSPVSIQTCWDERGGWVGGRVSREVGGWVGGSRRCTQRFPPCRLFFGFVWEGGWVGGWVG